jgi:hypothetical protein
MNDEIQDKDLKI